MKSFIKITVFLSIGLLLTAAIASAYPLNDNRPFTEFATGELQTLLKNKAEDGRELDVINDQSEAALWGPAEGDTTTYLIRSMTFSEGVGLGLYSAKDVSRKHLFPSQDKTSITINDSGDLYLNEVLVDPNFGSTFGFFLDWGGGIGYQSYSEDSKNSTGHGIDGNILALAYLIPDGFKIQTEATGGTTVKAKANDDWILAFDNVVENDPDFTDAVYYVEDMDPVPEPATMILFGIGLACMAGFYRNRKSA